MPALEPVRHSQVIKLLVGSMHTHSYPIKCLPDE